MMLRALLLAAVLAAPALAQTRPTTAEVNAARQAALAAQAEAEAADPRDRAMLGRRAVRLSVRADSVRDASRRSASADVPAPQRPGAVESSETERQLEPAPASPRPWRNPLVLAVLAAMVVLTALGAWWFTKGPGATRFAAGVVPQASRPARTGADQLRRHGAAGGQPPFDAAAEIARLTQQVDAQQGEIDDLRAWATGLHEEMQAARVPAAPAAAPSYAPPEAPPDAPTAFADWCRQATPMMSRVDFFDNHLRARVPGASAQAVYRDLNAQAEPVRFDGRGGASPAEFWLVTAGGEALLFPQPLNAHQFRDLTRVFDGTATPASLGSIAPARVRDEGATYALTTPGRVSGR